MIAKQASAMSMSELTLSLLQRDQPEIWHYLDQMPHSTPRAGLLYKVAKNVPDLLLIYRKLYARHYNPLLIRNCS